MRGPQGEWETYLKKTNNGRGPSVLLSGYYISFWLFLVFFDHDDCCLPTRVARYDVETVRCVADRVVGDNWGFGCHRRMPADHPSASEFSESVTITRRRIRRNMLSG
jgi:hypothetical protein